MLITQFISKQTTYHNPKYAWAVQNLNDSSFSKTHVTEDLAWKSHIEIFPRELVQPKINSSRSVDELMIANF